MRVVLPPSTTGSACAMDDRFEVKNPHHKVKKHQVQKYSIPITMIKSNNAYEIHAARIDIPITLQQSIKSKNAPFNSGLDEYPSGEENMAAVHMTKQKTITKVTRHTRNALAGVLLYPSCTSVRRLAVRAVPVFFVYKQCR